MKLLDPTACAVISLLDAVHALAIVWLRRQLDLIVRYAPGMAYFFARLLARRSDFPANMTPEERATMGAHSAFLAEQLANGTLVVAGPVMAPGGAFGMAVLDCPSLDAAQELLARDPANAIGSYEVSPMAAAVARPRS